MLFQTLDKLKRQSVLAAVLLVAVGVIMLICPDDYMNALIVASGYVMIIFALVKILDFIAGKKALIHYIVFTGAIVVAVFGVIILIYSEDLLKALGWLFGFVLAQDGIFTFLNALIFARRSGRRGWWVMIVLSAVLLSLGALIFINPFWGTPDILMKIIGGALLFSSVISALRLIWIWPFKNEEEGESDAA